MKNISNENKQSNDYDHIICIEHDYFDGCAYCHKVSRIVVKKGQKKSDAQLISERIALMSPIFRNPIKIWIKK